MMNHTQSLTGRLKSQSDYYCYPVVDCPECKETDVPYGVFSSSNSEEYITHYYCLNCKHSTLQKPEIKGWITLLDLEECGWDSEL